MAAKDLDECSAIYERLGFGEQGSWTYAGATDDTLAWEAFARSVEQLERMHAEGLIEIVLRHRETQTGHARVDMVLFKRLA